MRVCLRITEPIRFRDEGSALPRELPVHSGGNALRFLPDGARGAAVGAEPCRHAAVALLPSPGGPRRCSRRVRLLLAAASASSFPSFAGALRGARRIPGHLLS